MGWFWSDITPTPPASGPDNKPPPSCPMHDSSASKWPFRKPLRPTSTSSTDPPSQTEHRTSSSWLSKINPLNRMPSLPNAPTGPSQTFYLPLEREVSSIPRGPSAPKCGSQPGYPVKHSPDSGATEAPAHVDVDAESPSGNWQYPSPQQMYNALLRKGYTDTDPSAIPAMVSVHNFLNEGAWAEILEWERRFCSGLLNGWRISTRGEENSHFGAMLEFGEEGWEGAMRETREYLQLVGDMAREDEAMRCWDGTPQPRLLRFEGRPNDRSPKSLILQLVGMVNSRYASGEPFDRHDWYVQREGPDGRTTEVRYVIDYYGGPDEETGEPVFFLDVRPAIDNATSLGERLVRWGGNLWWQGSGRKVRDEKALEAAAKSQMQQAIDDAQKQREEKIQQSRARRERERERESGAT